MALTAKGKIVEMMNNNKADISVQIEYAKMEKQYLESKEQYKKDRKEYEKAQVKLDEAKGDYKEAEDYLEQQEIKNKIKQLKKNLKEKEQEYSDSREKYKEVLKRFKLFKRAIRVQSRACKAYETFFQRLEEAKSMGIEIPKYIEEEAAIQKETYEKAIFSINKNSCTFIPVPDKQCSKELASLILNKKIENAKESVKKTVTKVKQAFKPKNSDDKER